MLAAKRESGHAIKLISYLPVYTLRAAFGYR
jgi:hypothetical protein